MTIGQRSHLRQQPGNLEERLSGTSADHRGARNQRSELLEKALHNRKSTPQTPTKSADYSGRTVDFRAASLSLNHGPTAVYSFHSSHVLFAKMASTGTWLTGTAINAFVGSMYNLQSWPSSKWMQPPGTRQRTPGQARQYTVHT
jgi:hypothetical protein